MVDLNSLVSVGENLEEAFGINSSGQIIANSSTHAYLLTPISVPEPSTFTLLPVGLCGLFFGRKRPG
jgi:hypothetical protein